MMRAQALRAVVGPCAVALAVALAGCTPPPPDEDENTPPTARMFLPQLTTIDVPAPFDARPSRDTDGDALHFALNPGDGGPSAASPDGVFAHVYDEPGTFDVELVVTDDEGAEAIAVGQVVVVTDDASCDCGLGCFDDASCTPGGCVLFVSSDSDDDAVPADAIDCD